jgi:hypothetical protein
LMRSDALRGLALLRWAVVHRRCSTIVPRSVVEVFGGEPHGVLRGRHPLRDGEAAGHLARQDGDLVVELVRHCEVWSPIAVEVGGGDPVGVVAGVDRRARFEVEGAVAVAQIHGDAVGLEVREGEIGGRPFPSKSADAMPSGWVPAASGEPGAGANPHRLDRARS